MRRCFLHQGVRITTLLTSLRAIPDAHRAPVLMVLALYGMVYPPVMPPPVGTFRTSRRGLPGGPRGPPGGDPGGGPGGPARAPGENGPPRARGGPPGGSVWGVVWSPKYYFFYAFGGVSWGGTPGGRFWPVPARGAILSRLGELLNTLRNVHPPAPRGSRGSPPGDPPPGGSPGGYPGYSPGLPFPSLAVNLRLRLATPRR